MLASARHQGPLTVQRPFYPEEDVCHLYLLHPPAGIVGGDELHIAVTLNENSHALITQPGAGKFYRSGGPQALLRQHFTLAPHATLEWLPEDTILFRRQRHYPVRLSHRVGESTAGLGSAVPRATSYAGVLQPRLAAKPSGSVAKWAAAADRALAVAEGELSGVAHHPWVGTLLCYPATENMLEGTRERLTPLGDYAGATLNDSLLTIRFLADDNLIVQRVMRDIWQFLRPLLTHKPPVLPRIWQT